MLLSIRHSVLLLAASCAAFASTAHPPKPAPEPLRPSPAAVALFVNSNLDSARTLAAAALRQNPADVDALFVQMEAASLAADTNAQLDAALRLCEIGRANDPRVTVAAARVLDLAGNTTQFRAAIPRIQRLIASGARATNFLRAALVAAAAEGAPGLSTLQLARQSGLLTDWRLVGPFGEYPNVAFDRSFAPEHDGLSEAKYSALAQGASSAPSLQVETVRFDDGNFLLPDYFSQAGIFYGATDVTIAAAGDYRLRLESGGSAEIFVDGMSALRKDDRFHATPEIAWTTLRLGTGTHRVLVKFAPSAAPFRIALLPSRESKTPAPAPFIAEPEAGYVRASERFWLGDYDGAVAQLTALRGTQQSAAVDFLLAEAWSHAAGESPEEPSLLESALKQAPLALAAEFELAARAYEAERIDEAYAQARRVADAHPDYVPAQHLLAAAAMRLNWHAEAVQAYEAELKLRPACSTLRSAATFFASIEAYARAAQVERQLDGCAPGSLAYAEVLGDEGRHLEAAQAAQNVIDQNSLNREARALLARELAAAGQTEQARHAADELVALAPNATRFHTLAEQVSSGVAVDHTSPRGSEFASGREFYAAYRRNGPEIIRKTASRRFSGGPAVVPLYDRIARLGPRCDNTSSCELSLYVHKVTRVLNRDGIEKYGEVAVPRGADLLELRTIKQDGTIVEPEFNQHKSTVSMPALSVGDAIEEEYVVHYAEGNAGGRSDALAYTFGSFAAPILYARFAVIAPEPGTALQIVASPDFPAPKVTAADGMITRTWEQENIPQSTEETSAPRTGVLPSVRLVAARRGGWADLRDFYRNEVIEALRIGARVEASADELRGDTPDETARKLYRMVTTRLRSTSNAFDAGELDSAESTLANFSGNRTAALLAMARAEGLDAELLLARDTGTPRPMVAEMGAYTHPLVRFRIGGKEILADAESEGLALGVVPPTLAHDDALAVPLTDSASQQAKVIVPLPAATGEEQSLADGDVNIDSDGNLRAKVTIRMGASRSAQMRSILGGVAPGERKHFFEQLALRIFPGALDSDGIVENEHDAEQPLQLVITCGAPHFVNFSGDTVDMDQLAPALGLRKMYGLGARRFPLYIDTPLIETTTFRVHLPAGTQIAAQAENSRLNNEFGSYKVEFTQPTPGELTVIRSFRIPVQVIAPERFEAFSRFARQIDDAERQRITLARSRTQTTAKSGRD